MTALAVELGAQVVHHHRHGVDVVDRDVEEALDLAGVQVHGQDAMDARGGQQIGDQAGGDGGARPGLAVLAGVAEVGHDRDDGLGRRALERVDHDQQLHQVVVDRGAGGLHHEAVHAADVLVDLDVDLAVGEALDLGAAQRLAQVLAHGAWPARGWRSR